MYVDRFKIIEEGPILPERTKATEIEWRVVAASEKEKVGPGSTPQSDFSEVRHKGRDDHF